MIVDGEQRTCRRPRACVALQKKMGEKSVENDNYHANDAEEERRMELKIQSKSLDFLSEKIQKNNEK